MSWIVTYTGREYFLEGMQSINNDFDLPCIAHALSQINRFAGHTIRPYSVAEHSLFVSALLQEQGYTTAVQLAGLMHDAHEAYVGDVSTPLKHVLGVKWQMLEDAHARALRSHFRLLSTFAAHHDLIKRADLVALATERRDLLNFRLDRDLPWAILDKPGHEIRPYPEHVLLSQKAFARTPKEWAVEWLSHYETLLHAVMKGVVA